MSIKKVKYGGPNEDVIAVYLADEATGEPESAVPVTPEDGMTAQPVNATVTVATTTTALIAAATAGVKARHTLIYNTGTRTVHVAEGENATTLKFPVPVGAVFKSDSLLAINGIVAAGSDGSVAVIAEARS